MQHTRSQGSPHFAATSEPERDLHECSRRFRERFSHFYEIQVRIPIPIANMGDADLADLPARRTVHQRACDEFIGARYSITRPNVPNTNNWQILSHVMSTITNSTQLYGLEDEDAPGHLSRFARICDTFRITGAMEDAIYMRLFPFTLSGRGHIMEKKEPEECEEMFECFSLADQQQPSTRNYIPSARTHTSSIRVVHQVTPDTSMATALAAMAREIKELKKSAQRCKVCRGGHNTIDCPGWRSSGNPPGFQSCQNQFGGGDAGTRSGGSDRDKKIGKMLENQTQMLAELIMRDKETQQRLDVHDTLLRNQQSTFLDLQRTVGDIAKHLNEK
ncbi:hypothetical protein L1987_57691 [Smallanthus sonchifolius]|uniref:Uncharacterized protein n=1 Tax=Smallanthus sonchifolius TaxID=185202 RepID=A0ACB9DDP6_9ASTR|nr:hypothetical protein L1987_57691 [Smallanthus sonchifolius]